MAHTDKLRYKAVINVTNKETNQGTKKTKVKISKTKINK